MKTILLCGLLLLAACAPKTSPTDGTGGPREPNPNEQPR